MRREPFAPGYSDRIQCPGDLKVITEMPLECSRNAAGRRGGSAYPPAAGRSLPPHPGRGPGDGLGHPLNASITLTQIVCETNDRGHQGSSGVKWRLRWMAGLVGSVLSKHGLQNTKDLNKCVIRQSPQPLYQAISVDRPKLISHHVAILAIKSTTHPKRIRVSACCKWRNNECPEMGIQLIWGDDNARPCLPDFRPTRGIQCNKKNVSP
jgi:hypothetical protein